MPFVALNCINGRFAEKYGLNCRLMGLFMMLYPRAGRAHTFCFDTESMQRNQGCNQNREVELFPGKSTNSF